MKQTVALIFGGEGFERHISELSAENLYRAIDKTLYDVLLVGISPRGEWYFCDGNVQKLRNGEWLSDSRELFPTYPVKLRERSGLLSEGEILDIACAIPCLHGDGGEDGIIQGALRAAHINYVGQDVYASAMTADKAYTKTVAEHLSIPTAKWTLLTTSDVKEAARTAEELGFPLFLKPARLGSSIGAHPVRDLKDFLDAFLDAREYDERILCEELIPIKYELECAFLKTESKTHIAPFGRISADGFYDFGTKYESKGSPKIDADGESEYVTDLAHEYSERLADFIGLSDLGRIDFFVSTDGKLYFNEINTFPGMTAKSLYPRLTERMGLLPGEFINQLIEAKIDRHI